MALFAMFGALMFGSKMLMEFLPNIHLLGMFTVLFTVVYRTKALIPIYIYVFLNGLIAGFNAWWVPYLYIWTVLWGVVMLLPRNMPRKWAVVVYPVICSLHGFLFGTLYAPAQALMFGLDFRQMIAWIISGIPFDVIHGISNFVVGLLIYPLAQLLRKLSASVYLKIG
ncbi:MAG: hypothetical protein IJ298_08200 [Ruminococcus sp.]|nr:hypothetical protein [Ruminococcus sp.]